MRQVSGVISITNFSKDTSVRRWHVTRARAPLLWLQLAIICYLPATTIFSSLPFRAWSLLLGRLGEVLSAIESGVTSDTETRRSQTTCVCVWEKSWEYGSVFRDASIHRARTAGMAHGEGGVERRRRKRHQYEYSSCVGNVVHCILTNQGVNMTLAQKPTVHRVRERN